MNFGNILGIIMFIVVVISSYISYSMYRIMDNSSNGLLSLVLFYMVLFCLLVLCKLIGFFDYGEKKEV